MGCSILLAAFWSVAALFASQNRQTDTLLDDEWA